MMPHAFATDVKQTPTLYYDLGQKDGWVPFRKPAITGGMSVLNEITVAMQADSGIEFLTVNFPQKRAEKALLDGILDFDFLCLEWLPGNHPGEGFVATDPLFEITVHLVTLKQNTHLFPTRESMLGKQVGTIGGYFYIDDDKFTRSDFLNENLQLQGLKHDHFQVIISERETAKYWANVNKMEIGFGALLSKGKLVMRLREEHRALLPLLNQSIKILKSSGKLRTILDKHGVDSKISEAIPQAIKE